MSPPLKIYRKKPCKYCRKWFRPDSRVGDRQRVCSAPACQARRDSDQKARWRRLNPDYFAWRRIQAKGERPEVPVLRPPLDRLPWEVAQTEFGAQGAEFMAIFGRLLHRDAQTQLRLQAPDTS